MTGWTLRNPDGTQKRLAVPKRTQAQRDAAKRNVEHPPAPSGYKRHGQTDALR